MTLWHKYYGQDTSWQHRVSTYWPLQYIRITKAQSYWLKMANGQAAGALNTKCMIFLWQKRSKKAFCPRHDMLADFFTKPIQRTLFRQMCDTYWIWTAEQVWQHAGVCLEKQKYGDANYEEKNSGWRRGSKGCPKVSKDGTNELLTQQNKNAEIHWGLD